MSKTAKTTENEEGDENILFDDGFSVVDDINTGIGSMEETQEKTNGKKMQDNNNPASNTKKTVADDKKEDSISKETGDKLKRADKIVEIEKQTVKDKDSTDEQNTEPKTEVPKTCGDSGTLILSNDVDLGSETTAAETIKVKVEKVSKDTEEAKPKNESPSEEKSTTVIRKPLRKKGTSSSFVWVMNISNSVNASSLKKHFSDIGRVNTAKVVTNGRVFFGYLEFDTPKVAIECVEKMNNTMLGGKKILVSRSRPDVTKKTTSAQKKPVKNEQSSTKRSEEEAKKTIEEVKTDSKKTEDKTDKSKTDDKKKSDTEKKNEDKSKSEDIDKKKKAESDKKSKSTKEDSSKEEDLKSRMNETKKKLDNLRLDLDRTQIEVRNLRRRLTTEQKKSKAEELRAERYRQQLRKMTDELKEAKLEIKREIHHLTKKHKAELKKVEFDRESFIKREEDLRRRQDELDREFKKLDDAKKSFEHMKRTRKASRSISPPMKRFRGREVPYPDVSPPPPPKLSGDVRKPLLDRPPSSYYDEKKPRAIYERLGDYGDKHYAKDTNGRYRSTYPAESPSMPKSSWSQAPPEQWKKPMSQSSSTNFMKPYMERFGGGYQPQSSTYYPPSTSDYPKHFDPSRKY